MLMEGTGMSTKTAHQDRHDITVILNVNAKQSVILQFLIYKTDQNECGITLK